MHPSSATLLADRASASTHGTMHSNPSRAQESMMRLMDAVGAGMLLYRSNGIAYANPAIADTLAYTPESLIGQRLEDFATAEYTQILANWLNNQLEREQGFSSASRRVVVLECPDDELRHVQISATRITLEGERALMLTLQDVTARRRHQLVERMLSQIIDGDPVPTFVIDANHKVLHWNKACALVTGTAAEKVLGTPHAWAAFYGAPRPVMADIMVDGGLETGVAGHYQGKYRQSSVIPGAFEAEDFFPHFGECGRWLHFTAAPLRNDEGKIIGAIETLVDITERRQAEQELKHIQAGLEDLVAQRTNELASANRQMEADIQRREQVEQELRHRYTELEQLNTELSNARAQLVQSEKLASIGQLAAGVAHEINNPMGYVFSNISTLENYLGDLFGVLDAYEDAEPEIRNGPLLDQLHQIRRSKDVDFLKEDIPLLMRESREGISRVRKIVQDLKDFSRVDKQQQFEKADLHRGLNTTLNIVANQIKYKADVIREFGDLPLIECCPSQLDQVFLNLLVNAADAMPEGEKRGQIYLSTGTRNTAEGEFVWVEVRDTGSGISPEHLNKIFDPFFTTKPVGKGTGLGLSLSYSIIQEHHGQIAVTSAMGEGTTFRVTLPVVQPAAVALP